MKSIALALLSTSLVFADDYADLYGIEEQAKPDFSWNAGISMERNYQDSISSTVWISDHFQKEFSTIQIGLTPNISAYQLGWEDSLQFVDFSSVLELQWKTAYVGLTPWYSFAANIDYNEYGLFSQIGTEFSPWKYAWWNSYLYYSLGSESNSSYGIYSSLGHTFEVAQFWHGPTLAIDIPFSSETSMKGKRGKGMVTTLSADPVAFASYRLGYTTSAGRFDVWSQGGIAGDRNLDWELWGGAFASVSW